MRTTELFLVNSIFAVTLIAGNSNALGNNQNIQDRMIVSRLSKSPQVQKEINDRREARDDIRDRLKDR